MIPGHELNLRSKFRLGERIVYNDAFFGTVTSIFAMDIDDGPKILYGVRWDKEYVPNNSDVLIDHDDTWNSMLHEPLLRSVK